jgi:basic membrane protein A
MLTTVIIVVLLVALVAGVGYYYYSTQNGSGHVQSQYKVAAIFSGPVNDGNYNQLGYEALQALNASGVPTAYTENVPSPTATFLTDVQQYINEGFNIIWAHGGQFATAIGVGSNSSTALAVEYPNVIFIAEADNPAPITVPKNVWVIDRNFAPGFYVEGALAAMTSRSGTIGYIVGQQLPFANAEANAVIAGARSVNPSIKIYRTFTGDFNDPVKARTAVQSMLGLGADVIISALNLADSGIYPAIQGTPTLYESVYTNQYSSVPNNYLTSYLYNFTPPLMHVFTEIKSGVTSGYYKIPFSPSGGVYMQTPISNVNSTVQSRIQNIINEVVNGQITVAFNSTAPGPGP